MAAEQRVAKDGEKVSLDNEVLWTATKGHTYEIGINGRNIAWSVGTPPKQTDFTVEQMVVQGGTEEADLWAKEDGKAKKLKRLLSSDTNRFYLPGRDLQMTVKDAPVDNIVVGDSPWPKLKEGDNIEANLLKGPVALPRGKTFKITSTIDVTRDNLGIGAYGSGSKPVILATGGFRPISVVNKRAFVLDGIEVTTAVDNSIEPSLWAWNAPGLLVKNSHLWHGRQGLAVQADSLAQGGQFTVEDSLIRDCSRQSIGGKNYHGAGIYCDNVVPQLRRVMFDTCGWRPGYIDRDEYSHGIYVQGTSGDGSLFEDVFCYACSSHGLQARAGGIVRRYLALDCAIGFSYGLVNRSEIHRGGVRGSITDAWTVGCLPIRPTHRPGYAGEFGNCLDVMVNRAFAGDDDLGVSQAFMVRPCGEPLDNGPEVGIKRLIMQNIASSYTKGTYGTEGGRQATSVSYLKPLQTPSLRQALGGAPQFAAWARSNVSIAAVTGIKKCETAWGVQ